MSALKRFQVIESHVRPKLLEGKVAIITGSGQGIGAAAARLFAAQGAKVVVTDIDAKKAGDVTKEIEAAGGEALCVPGDIMNATFPDELVAKTIAKFGKLHYLVNNAGFTWDGMLHKMNDKQWETMLVVHQTAPFRMIRAAAPYMREAGKDEIQQNGKPDDRCIINISSTSGTHGNVGQCNYSTGKAGVVGLTKTICKEWGPFGVRANAIAFGFINTRLTRTKADGESLEIGGQKVALGVPAGFSKNDDVDKVPKDAFNFIPLQRPGKPEDAAGAIFMLCSPFSSYVSGQCLEVTGGSHI